MSENLLPSRGTASAGGFSKHHVRGLHSAALAVRYIKFAIAVENVVAAFKAKLLSRLVDPAGRAFQLKEVADGSFIESDGSRLVSACEFSAEFFVAERGLVSKLAENVAHCFGGTQR